MLPLFQSTIIRSIPQSSYLRQLRKMTSFVRTSGSNHTYDFIVIGGGSGGVRAARVAAAHGAKTVLIESGGDHHGPPTYTALGGTCVNVGCVPKKIMVYGSHYSEHVHEAKAFGWNIDASSITHDWKRLMEKKNTEIDRLNGIYGGLLGRVGCEIVLGRGMLKDANTVKVDLGNSEMRELTADTILIAVGGWPFKPSIPGIKHAITSNEIFYLDKRPERVVVVGGGYIAVEFACILKGYGSAVTLMYRGPQFLRGFDQECRDHLEREMREHVKVDLKFNTNPASIEKLSSGALKITTEAGDVVECDQVLYATGRKPKINGIGLETVGVQINKKGAIVVDELSCSSVPNIYAVGDVTDRINLTPVALHEGHCLADTLYGGKERKPDHSFVASTVFSNPEIGSCGYTEAEAVKKFGDVTVYSETFRPLMHTITLEDTKTLMKLIVDDATNRVVGVHMCGPNSADTMQGIAVAIKAGATKAHFDATIGIHPCSAEELVTMRTPKRVYKGGILLV